MKDEFAPYELAVKLKELGFDEPCLAYYNKEVNFNLCWKSNSVEPYNHNDTNKYDSLSAPTFSQAINFLYICSNKQIDIELKASDTYEERLRKVDKGCEDLWNLQNSKPN